MERYFYAHSPQHGPLGLIAWDSWLKSTAVCPAPWQPNRVDYPGAECWGQLALQGKSHMNRVRHIQDSPGKFYASNAEFISELLGTVASVRHDTKLVLRLPNEAAKVTDTTRPHLRGGFIQAGSGRDFTGRASVSGDWVFLENNNFAHDYYLYRQGTDPLVSSGPFCRENYGYRGAIVSNGTWSGLDRSFQTGIGWTTLCGTSWDVYFGGASCASGYLQRGHFYAAHDSWVCNPTTRSCAGQPANSWVNLCVKASQVSP